MESSWWDCVFIRGRRDRTSFSLWCESVVKRCQEARKEPLATKSASWLLDLPSSPRIVPHIISAWATLRPTLYLTPQRHWATLDHFQRTASPMPLSPGTSSLQGSRFDFEDCSQKKFFSAQEIPCSYVLPGTTLYKSPFPISSLIPTVSFFRPQEMESHWTLEWSASCLLMCKLRTPLFGLFSGCISIISTRFLLKCW